MKRFLVLMVILGGKGLLRLFNRPNGFRSLKRRVSSPPSPSLLPLSHRAREYEGPPPLPSLPLLLPCNLDVQSLGRLTREEFALMEEGEDAVSAVDRRAPRRRRSSNVATRKQEQE